MTRRTLSWVLAVAVLGIAAAGATTTAAAPATASAPGDDPRPEGDDPKPTRKPGKVEKAAPDPLADLKVVARAAFKACLEPNDSRAFNMYIDIVHPEQKEAGHAVDQIRRYSWKKFRAGCYQWLKDKKRLEFVISRTSPSKVTKETDAVKLFFKAQQKPKGGGPLRYDAPMELRKDGSRWFIWRNSL